MARENVQVAQLAQQLSEMDAAQKYSGVLGGMFGQEGGPTHVSFEDVDWDRLVRGGLLSKEDLNELKMCEDHPMDYVMQTGGKGQSYVGLLVKLLKVVTGDTMVQYFAVSRVEDALSEDSPKRAKLFLDESTGALDVNPFMRALQSGDTSVQQVCGHSLALLCVHLDADIEPLVFWICEQLSSGRGSSPTVRVAVQSLSILLRTERARVLFASHGGVGYLNRLLRMQGSDLASAQLLYELCFCLWSIALCEDTRHDFLACGAVPTLVEQVAAAPREKIVRVALATLRLLSEGQVIGFNSEMISCGLPSTLANLKSRQWADIDIGADVDFLFNRLQDNYRDLSTFEIYSQEVLSGKLKWGVVHTEKFWREHVRETEADDFNIMKKLIQLLRSEDDVVQAVACSDVGEFVRFYPSGKSIVKHLGAKEVAMDLLEHPNKDVRDQALQCVSKIMVNNWAFVK